MSIVIGYVRVSTDGQGESGLGLAAQRAAILEDRFRSAEIRREVASGGRVNNRRVLRRTLDELRRGDTLVVSKLDRLARSAGDFHDIAREAQRRGWHLVVLDLGIDTATPMGKAMISMAATFAELERDMIGARIRDAFAVKRGQGDPRQASTAARARILELRAAGLTQNGIAEALTDEGWEPPCARGRTGASWHRSLVRRVLDATE